MTPGPLTRQCTFRVTAPLGKTHVAAEVREPSGQTYPWVMGVECVPPQARPHQLAGVDFSHGEERLYGYMPVTAPRGPVWTGRKRSKRS